MTNNAKRTTTKGRSPKFQKKRCRMLSRFISANFPLIYDEGLKRPETQKVFTDRLIPSEVCEHFVYLAMKKTHRISSVHLLKSAKNYSRTDFLIARHGNFSLKRD
jgi:hypothetical protein